jgi:hypothetical protein
MKRGLLLVVVTNTSRLLAERNKGVLLIVFRKLTAREAERKMGTPFVVEMNEVAAP